MSKKFSKQQLIDLLIDFSIKHQTVNISKSDMDADKNYPSSPTFKRYFGSWGDALKSAGLQTGVITGRPQDPPITINSQALEIINGEMLGDGSMSLSGSYKTNACFEHSTANIHYGEYLYNKLDKYVPLLHPTICPERNNGKKQFRTRTTVNVSWTKLHSKWYEENRKIVPEDITLTKETCRHWYLGDGYFEDETSKISTCNFNKRENELLVELLNNIGYKSNINKRSGDYYVIRFSKYSYKDFLEWIGNPIKGYEHRWGR